ncbi:hypothetical protein Pcinc_013962 [Petrolisthes cinctipes]|uniref:SCAN box domain-containing protein n=1 Tax=Petrolisthes cinctipes TaxID=88211 RepID=A0AAE1FW97_PETCI|nr:hypothetical protein Pcinc_013962 [Petrolisthes cinctipes]
MSTVQELLGEAQLLGIEGKAELQVYVKDRQEEERLERAAIRENEREQREQEKLKWEHEKEVLELKLRASESQSSSGSEGVSSTTVTPRLQLSKYVEGDDIEPFIERFEMVADTYRLNDDIKKLEFINLFDGKALSILHRLDSTARDYENMKKALLQAYGLTVDDARNQFWRASLQDKETVAQFSARLTSYLDQWLEKAETPKTLEGVKDLLLRTQLEKSCPPELSAQLKTNKVKMLETMVDMADAHFTAYGYHTRIQHNKKINQSNKPSQNSAVSYNQSSKNQSQQQSQIVRLQPNPHLNHTQKQGNNHYSQQSNQYRYQGKSNWKNSNNHSGNKGYYQRSAAATQGEPQYSPVAVQPSVEPRVPQSVHELHQL